MEDDKRCTCLVDTEHLKEFLLQAKDADRDSARHIRSSLEDATLLYVSVIPSK